MGHGGDRAEMHWEEGTISEQGSDHHATSDVSLSLSSGTYAPSPAGSVIPNASGNNWSSSILESH